MSPQNTGRRWPWRNVRRAGLNPAICRWPNVGSSGRVGRRVERSNSPDAGRAAPTASPPRRFEHGVTARSIDCESPNPHHRGGREDVPYTPAARWPLLRHGSCIVTRRPLRQGQSQGQPLVPRARRKLKRVNCLATWRPSGPRRCMLGGCPAINADARGIQPEFSECGGLRNRRLAAENVRRASGLFG